MKKLSKYTFIIFTQLMLAGTLMSQDAMRISGTQIVRKGETMTIEAGKLVQFESGATLQVEGSLVVKGTVEKPVVFQSVDATNPGNGIMVRGIDEAGIVAMENVKVEGLIQALRFDPFWYRKRIDLNGMTISGSNSGEPIIYVAGPLLDLREGMDIDFRMKSMNFYNNTGAVLLEKVGSDGISYSLDKLLFSENNLPGADATMGVLHLDVARTSSASQLKLGELAFNRNTSGNNVVGLSMSGGSGTGTEKFGVDAVYAETGGAVVYDNRVNSRVPAMEIAKVARLSEYSEVKDFVVSAKHNFGKVSMSVVGNPRVVKMEDSLGRPVFNNANRIGDTLFLRYLEGNPTVITLANGQKFMVPKLTAAELPLPIYRRVDTLFLERIVNKPREDLQWDRLMLRLILPIPMGGNHSKLDSLETWEVGQWSGGSIYAGGDIKHKYSPLPSSMEYSYGIYLQKNLHQRFSYSFDYNYCKISMHNVAAAGLFSGAKVPEVLNPIGYTVPVFGSSYQLMFMTPIHSVGFNALWHLNDNQLSGQDKSKWISTLGFGLGTIYFTPYRLPYYSRKYNYQNNEYSESIAEYKSRMLREKVNLRKIGSEGQNILPGMNRYSAITACANTSFRLTYKRKRFSLSGEIKAIITFSDYLDDFGPGLYYGGNRDLVYEYAEQNFDYSQNQLKSALPVSAALTNAGAQKSTNGLTDGYYQMHLGLAYHLNPTANDRLNNYVSFKQKMATIMIPSDNNWKSHELLSFDSFAFKSNPGFLKNIEFGTWMGAGMYIGDIKPKFFPYPSSMEVSLGVFAQINHSPKINWKVSYYNTGISARHPSSVLLISSVELPQILDANGNQINFPDWWLNFNTKMNIVDVDCIRTLGNKGYFHKPNKRFALRSQVGAGIGLGSYQVFKVLRYGRSEMINLRKYGMEGERIKGSKSKFSNNFGLVSGSYILTMFCNHWTIKGEIKGAITTSDKLDGYGNGLWFGGDIDQWYESTDEMPDGNGLKVNSYILKNQYEKMVASGMSIQQQRAKNRLPDGYVQFHLGISYSF